MISGSGGIHAHAAGPMSLIPFSGRLAARAGAPAQVPTLPPCVVTYNAGWPYGSRAAEREVAMVKPKMTVALARALDDVEGYLRQAHEEARKRFAEAGFQHPPDLEPHFECLRCDCDHFTPKRSGGTCDTPGCGHSFFSHNAPR